MKNSVRETQFENLWDALFPDNAGIWLSQSYFDLNRSWKFDKSVISKLLAVEIHGGGFVGGRHNREFGMSADFEKHNAATAAGWRIFYMTTSMLENDPLGTMNCIIKLLNQPMLSPDAEYTMWVARVRNLIHIGDEIFSTGIFVKRLKANRFLVETGGNELVVGGGIPLAQAQQIVLETVMVRPRVSEMEITEKMGTEEQVRKFWERYGKCETRVLPDGSTETKIMTIKFDPDMLL